jgi:PPOX class probable F420-dependent enzyme
MSLTLLARPRDLPHRDARVRRTRDNASVPKATPAQLTDDALAFLTERHLATFSSLRADGTVHVTACGFTFDPESGIARVITSGGGQKAKNAEGGVAAALCQVDGARWLTVEGVATTSADPAAVRDAERRYAQRYRVPRENPQRVVIELVVERVLGSRAMIAR